MRKKIVTGWCFEEDFKNKELNPLEFLDICFSGYKDTDKDAPKQIKVRITMEVVC